MFENWPLTNISNISNRNRWILWNRNLPTYCSERSSSPNDLSQRPIKNISTKGGCPWSLGQTTRRCRRGLIHLQEVLNELPDNRIFVEGIWGKYDANATHVTCASALNHVILIEKLYSIMAIAEVFQILCVCHWNFRAPGHQGYRWYDCVPNVFVRLCKENLPRKVFEPKRPLKSVSCFPKYLKITVINSQIFGLGASSIPPFVGDQVVWVHLTSALALNFWMELMRRSVHLISKQG